MNQLIILVALPGSGKSFYGNSLKKLLGTSSNFLDDIKDLNLLEESIRNYKTTIIADPLLTSDKTRKLAESYLISKFPKVPFQWIFWENNLEDAWENVKKRNDGRIVSKSFLKQLSSEYNPPHIDFKVYKKELK
jgi:predicted kinase